MKKLIFNIIILVLLSTTTFAQVGIGTNTPQGALDVVSDNSGIIIPRVANIAAVTNPVNGMMVFDLENQCINLFSNSEWRCLINEKPENQLLLAPNSNKCQDVTIQGNFFAGAYLRDQKISGSINIKNLGSSYVFSDEIDGVSFSSEQSYNTLGVNSFTVNGSGSFTTPGNKTFTLSNGINSCEVDVTVSSLPALDEKQVIYNQAKLAWGLDFDSNGDIYFTDELVGGGDLYKISLSDGTNKVTLVSEETSGRGVTYHKGKIYTSSPGENRIEVYDIQTNKVNYLRDAQNNVITSFTRTFYNRIDPITGNLYISSPIDGKIYVYNFETRNKTTLKSADGNDLAFNNPLVFEFDKQGNFYIRSGTNILKVDRLGNTTKLKDNFGNDISINGIEGIALDALGNIYVTSGSVKKIYKINANDNSVEILKNQSNQDLTFVAPRSILFNSEGQLYVAGGTEIVRVY